MKQYQDHQVHEGVTLDDIDIADEATFTYDGHQYDLPNIYTFGRTRGGRSNNMRQRGKVVTNIAAADVLTDIVERQVFN